MKKYGKGNSDKWKMAQRHPALWLYNQDLNSAVFVAVPHRIMWLNGFIFIWNEQRHASFCKICKNLMCNFCLKVWTNVHTRAHMQYMGDTDSDAHVDTHVLDTIISIIILLTLSWAIIIIILVIGIIALLTI